jgi:hypothetical protein
MRKPKITSTQYLFEVYGLEPSDLDLQDGTFDIAEVERLAEKYNLTKRENMTLEKAKSLNIYQVTYH